MQSPLGRRKLVLRSLAGNWGIPRALPNWRVKANVASRPCSITGCSSRKGLGCLPMATDAWWPWPCFLLSSAHTFPVYDLTAAWLQLPRQIYVPDSRCTHPTPTHSPPPLNFSRSMLTWASSAVPDLLFLPDPLSQWKTPSCLWTCASSLNSLG